jgi:hypothetical protein
MSSDTPPDPPGNADVALILTKAGLNLLPYVGGPAAELLDLLRLPAAKRQYAYLTEIAIRLRQLEREERLSVEGVVKSDVFLSTVLRCIDAARRTAEREKLDALRNGVLNVALSESVDEALTQMFVDWIDRFTAWHLRVLAAADDPQAWTQSHAVTCQVGTQSTVADFLRVALPDLVASRPDFFRLIWGELHQAHLVELSLDDLQRRYSDSGSWPSSTTAVGKAFLRFTENPSLRANAHSLRTV